MDEYATHIIPAPFAYREVFVSKKLLVSLALLASPAIYAEEFLPSSDSDDAPPSPLQTEVEFGYQAHSGNTDSQSLNARVAAEYTQGRHRTSGEWKYYQLYKNGDEDKNQQNYLLQTDYKLGPKAYLYGNYNGFSSLYSSYYEDHTVSGGLGYQIANTKTLLFEVEVGPGYRYQEPNVDEIDDKDIIFPNIVREAIVRGNINLLWKPLNNLTLGTKLTTTSGKSNTRFDTEVNVTNAITETIALKVAYDSQYHSKVPGTLSKRDSIFTVNLLFSF
ncbi:putative salt-induced outer membrane protein [Vibrio hangzhouensis]|uniref:Putative salt-induced outer membrane protein n=1 Tax=Vibrio hangzhouensis TaxID=462991 RepID=A0A1H6BS30_9VIBR|nr:putative salt-induced outer membrane protein [Vibrio hangzhouensis]